MLQGANIVLRAWAEADIEPLRAVRNDVETQLLLMAEPRPNSKERVRAWLQARSTREDEVFFVIARAHDDQAVGFVQARRIDRSAGWAYLGLCMAAGHRAQGGGREALALLEKYLVDVLGLRKLLLEVLVSNERAIAFYRQACYREVGILHAHHRARETLHDVMIMEKMLAATKAHG